MAFAQGLGENKSVRITLFLQAQMRVLKIVQVVGQRVSYLLAGLPSKFWRGHGGRFCAKSRK
jgi:hypothetical protein